jgi:hydrogenase maturation protein HypF
VTELVADTRQAQRHEAVARREVVVRGVVQGVGFRPYIYGLATGLGLAGHVTNTGGGVLIEVEGPRAALEEFCARIGPEAPALARVESVEARELAAVGAAGFGILASHGGAAGTLVPPDTATCADCLAELADPADRRHRHPFITCTNCGPRFTIVKALPYDREQTTMAGFPMCAACASEYRDPGDRRFHAQPISCHDCGPRLSLRLARPRPPGRGGPPVPAIDAPAVAAWAVEDPAVVAAAVEDPIAGARRLLADGAVLAVKGIGGYHLACDAANPDAVGLLRRRKARGDKPFAVMARGIADITALAELDEAERALLESPARPIVLLRRRRAVGDAATPAATPAAAALEAVAPGLAELGFLLPYTPVHRLLLGLDGDAAGPRLLVMTSGNLSGEPLAFEDEDAFARLAPLVDAWLTHDRPIHVPCDDSVLRVCDGEPLPVRRSRGYVPLPIDLPVPVARTTLAVGGDLKNALCVASGRRAWLSAHVGDMDDTATQRAFERAGAQLAAITAVQPELLAADAHPGYRSTRWARHDAAGRPRVEVQHHHAHVAAAMAEHGLDGGTPVIGVAFDGTGYGTDGAVWGGEVLIADYRGFQRFAHLAYVPLPGGDSAVRRPYRMALAHLAAAGIDWSPRLACTLACPEQERRVLARQIERGVNCVPTSSMGRLFDAVSALIGIRQHNGYEAQAAMELESAAAAARLYADADADADADAEAEPELDDATAAGDRRRYRFEVRAGGSGPLTAHPAPVLASILADLHAGTAPGSIALAFHTAVADLVAELCTAARERHGLDTVALTGGVFANTLLSAGCARHLREAGFLVLRHRLVPPNDGGLALGQAVIASAAGAGRLEHPMQ